MAKMSPTELSTSESSTTQHSTTDELPTFDDILDAAARLEGVVHRTPVMTSATLDSRAGAEVFLKCENFQRIGAFKIRGAYNALSRIPDSVTSAPGFRGVLAFSSGNHAQGVALAGRLLGLATTIVMPTDAPASKRAATEGYGARVVPYDREQVRREEVAAEMMAEGGYVLIPPYDHPHIIAGQGTAALELARDVTDLDLLLVPCGGGGLLSGSALAVRGLEGGGQRRCQVIGIEPELADDATRSFHTGRLHTIHNPRTIADGTRTPSLGELTFPLVRQHVDDMRTVSEEAIREAVRFLFYRTKMVVEPSGALGVAALLSGAVSATGKRVGVILSGGNIDGEVMASLLSNPVHSTNLGGRGAR